jgi:hypothetical protein
MGGTIMRVFVLRPFAFAIVGLAAVLSGRVLAQAAADTPAPGATSPAEVDDEVTVRGRKTMTQYRLEIEQARDEVFRLYNEANEGSDNDITCRAEQPTGSRMRQDVCRSEAESKAHAGAARDFLDALLMGSGMHRTGLVGGGPGPVRNTEIGTGVAQAAGRSGEQDALAAFEQEWKRLLSENRQLYRAVVKYSELQDEYNRARGSTTATSEPALAVVLEEPVAPAAAAGPQCAASTLTEYQQRNNVARVTGTVSISSCPAGTTGMFTLVARVRDDNGEIRPIEFNETWQRNDTQDHIFNTDYPIGENVELVSVRVRGLVCTCAEATQ